MRSTLALLLDAYRELNSKRLFWLVLIVSTLVAASFGGVGITPDAITVFGWRSPLAAGMSIDPPTFYKTLYVIYGIRLWMSWAAIILSIVSTAGMFPDFLASGAVDLYLARPISRLKLFLVKYAAGLLFVGLQVTLFSIASFFVIGIRGGVWTPGLFWAIPIVMAIFSYLFGVSVFVGVLTRSALAAMLVTMGFWMLLGGVNIADNVLLRERIMDDNRAANLDRQIVIAQRQLTEPDSPVTTQPAVASHPATPDNSAVGSTFRYLSGLIGSPAPAGDHQTKLNRLASLQAQRAAIKRPYDTAQQITGWAAAILPKTSDTISMLERELSARARLPDMFEEGDRRGNQQFRQRRADAGQADTMLAARLQGQSAWYVIGTSLLFEAVIVGWAAYIFCKRDY